MATLTRSSSVYRFGTFEANAGSGELLKKGARVRLQDKPFRLLLLLLEARGQVVTRDEIRTRLWPDGTFIEFDDSLNAAVKKLRAALNDSADHPRFLETVTKVGYRFIPPVGATREAPGSATSVQSASEDALGHRDVREDGRPPFQSAIPQGETDRHPMSSAPGSEAMSQNARLLHLLAAISVLLAVVMAAAYYLHKSGSQPNLRSIAVLPLENLSGDPQQQYIADGMTDELITDLAKVGSLRVISHTSVIQYRDRKKALTAIGRELNVDAIVEGTVVRADDKVRVTVQLINAHDDHHLWAESYERQTGDIVQLQGDIAEAIMDQIQIKLTASDKRRLSQPKPVNPEAHEAYLKGLYFLNERGRENLKRSIVYFEEAIRHDPGYALAYSGLADAYDISTDYDLHSPRDSYFKAKTAALKALELDPGLGRAHATLADMKSVYEWDWPGAEAEFKRALELNPGYATAHHWYSQYLTARGRFEEAMAEINRAMELDPLSPSINAFAGSLLYMARQYDKSAAHLTGVITAESSNETAHYFLGFTRERQGLLQEAIKEFQKAVDLSGGDPSHLAGLAHAYALSGNMGQARGIYAKLRQRATTEYVSSYDMAIVCLGLHHKEEAFDWLTRAYNEDDPNMNFLNVEPTFDDIRSEPQFTELLRRIGLRQ